MANNLMRLGAFGDLAPFDALRDFEPFFKRAFLGDLARAQDTQRIQLDVTETDAAYVVKADVPGARKEDIKVSVDGNVVSIQVETKRDQEERKGETVVRSERYYGVQSRRFSLERDIDDSQAKARYQDGVLTLELPKRADGQGVKALTIE